MTKFYVTRAYLGWNEEHFAEAKTRLMTPDRGPGGAAGRNNMGWMGPKGPEHDLENQGALFGTEVLAVGGTKEQLDNVAVLDLADENLHGELETLLEQVLDLDIDTTADVLFQFMKEHSVA